MFCRKCGTQNDDNAHKCVQCGQVLQQTPTLPGAPMGISVPNYLTQSILVTIFCCLPFGIPAIVFAAQVNGKVAQGDVTGAMNSSRLAKMWCWIAFGVGIAAIVVNIVINVVFVMSAANANK